MDFSSEQAGYVIKSQTVNNNDASELYVDCKQNGSYYVRGLTMAVVTLLLQVHHYT